MAKTTSTTATVTPSLSDLIAAYKAARTEGRLCQRNWQSEIERETPSEKRLSFLQNQAVRLNLVCSTLKALLPSDIDLDDKPKSEVNPMDFTF